MKMSSGGDNAEWKDKRVQTLLDQYEAPSVFAMKEAIKKQQLFSSYATQTELELISGRFDDHGDIKWIVIRGSLWGHSDKPCGRSAPGQHIGRLGSGHPQCVFGGFDY
jgi:hypothetical protein